MAVNNQQWRNYALSPNTSYDDWFRRRY